MEKFTMKKVSCGIKIISKLKSPVSCEVRIIAS